MIKFLLTLSITLFVVLLSSQCAYHKKEAPVLTPVDTTDTTGTDTTKTDTTKTKACETLAAVKYATDIASIVNDESCISCHESGVSGPLLKDYATFKSYITANEAKFLKAVNFNTGSDITNMPQGGTKMAADKLKTIETWICQGMKP